MIDADRMIVSKFMIAATCMIGASGRGGRALVGSVHLCSPGLDAYLDVKVKHEQGTVEVGAGMFELSKEHEDFRRVVREFALAEVAPHVQEWDEQHRFPV